MKLDFSQQIFEEYSNLMKIRSLMAELLHTDRRRDMTKLIIAFRNFAKAPIKDLTQFISLLTTVQTVGPHLPLPFPFPSSRQPLTRGSFFSFKAPWV